MAEERDEVSYVLNPFRVEDCKMVEQNPEESIRKFIRYSFPDLWEEFWKWMKSQGM